MRNFVVVLSLCAAAAAGAQTRGQADSEAERFLTRAERVLDSLAIRASRAQWVQQNFITDDTEILNAEASTELSIAVQRLATEAKKYDKATLPPATKRRLTLLKLALAAPPQVLCRRDDVPRAPHIGDRRNPQQAAERRLGAPEPARPVGRARHAQPRLADRQHAR